MTKKLQSVSNGGGGAVVLKCPLSFSQEKEYLLQRYSWKPKERLKICGCVFKSWNWAGKFSFKITWYNTGMEKKSHQWLYLYERRNGKCNDRYTKLNVFKQPYLLFLVLWEFCTMYFDHIHALLTHTRSIPHSLPTQLCVLPSLYHQEQCCL